MIIEKLSINKVLTVLFIFMLIISITIVTMLFMLTLNSMVVLLGISYVCIICGGILLFVFIVNRKISSFSNELCNCIDAMLYDDMEYVHVKESENIFAKINHHLMRLYDITRKNRQKVILERLDLQELISDISHQVKTPITNLKIVNSTLLNQPVTKEKQTELLLAFNSQLDKLDFLMQAMTKTSRLETGIISLKKKTQPIYDTLAAALSGVIMNAEKKEINITVQCNECLEVAHDQKWTAEALFNILDNATKYTSYNGHIDVMVSSWEMYLKIDIIDNGIGIDESHYTEIFKRFYREEKVNDTEGVGIGLTLAREIITLQGGYIKVESELEKGSIFSIFLPYV